MVLDINLFREEKGYDPQLIRHSQRARYQPVEWVDQLIEHDKLWRTSRYQCDRLKSLKGICSKVIATKKKDREADGNTHELPTDWIISLETVTPVALAALTIKQIIGISLTLDTEIEELEKKANEAENQRDTILLKIGNLVHSSVPVSDDEVRIEHNSINVSFIIKTTIF